MTEQVTTTELVANLANFYGSDQIYRHPIFQKRYSEGVKYLAEAAGAYWLLDAIFSHQADRKVAGEEFQVWKLTLNGASALLVCEDGNDNVVKTQAIQFTDFPLPEITLWYTNNTLYLPTEH